MPEHNVQKSSLIEAYVNKLMETVDIEFVTRNISRPQEVTQVRDALMERIRKELWAAEKLVQIYFEIAENIIGKEEVVRQRDERIDEIINRSKGGEQSL